MFFQNIMGIFALQFTKGLRKTLLRHNFVQFLKMFNPKGNSGMAGSHFLNETAIISQRNLFQQIQRFNHIGIISNCIGKQIRLQFVFTAIH